MEFCDRGTLEEATKMGLPEHLIAIYTKEILKAIGHLHEYNIVHRDIKGANIFLTSQGCLKLGDFGSSAKLKSQATMPGEFNNIVGTTGKEEYIYFIRVTGWGEINVFGGKGGKHFNSILLHHITWVQRYI